MNVSRHSRHPRSRRRPTRQLWDAIVVGSRVAGASTAMLLARRGHRVLLLDRRRPGSDTLSTHALMRAGVMQLERWGLLGQVIASGAPAVGRTVVHYGDEAEVIELTSRGGVRELFAPRRTVLDSLLVEAAEAAGVEVRFGVTVTGLVRDPRGRVLGVRGREAGGAAFEERAALTVGADGINSLVAREVEAPVTRRGVGATGLVYGYFAGPWAGRYDWFYRPGLAGGVIPTNGGQACVWVGAPGERFMNSLRYDLARSFEGLLEELAPPTAGQLRRRRQEGRLRAFRGVPGFMRRPGGPGWALVGDASHFKDPISAHGITDALRDAELLARAIDPVLTGREDEGEALELYEATRDRLSVELFDTADEIALFGWDLDRVRELLIRLSRAMKDEVRELGSLGEVATLPAA